MFTGLVAVAVNGVARDHPAGLANPDEVVPIPLNGKARTQQGGDGTLEWIDLPGRLVKIGGKVFILTPDAVVHGAPPKVALWQRIYGRHVSYLFDQEHISEIWLAPPE